MKVDSLAAENVALINTQAKSTRVNKRLQDEIECLMSADQKIDHKSE